MKGEAETGFTIKQVQTCAMQLVVDITDKKVATKLCNAFSISLKALYRKNSN